MPTRTLPSFGWRGDSWSPIVGRAIDRRLQARRDRFVALLNIDLSDVESMRPTEDMQQGQFVRLADLMLDELSGALRSCWSRLRDVNRAPSKAQIYRTLEAIQARPADAMQLFGSVDAVTRCLIEDHYPGGWAALELHRPKPNLLLDAIAKAKASLPKPRRGRPGNVKDEASRLLAADLAHIYAAYAGPSPTRRVKARMDGQQMEYGPFKDFVEEVLSVFPQKLRRTSKGGEKRADHIVRMGVESLKSPSKKPSGNNSP